LHCNIELSFNQILKDNLFDEIAVHPGSGLQSHQSRLQHPNFYFFEASFWKLLYITAGVYFHLRMPGCDYSHGGCVHYSL